MAKNGKAPASGLQDPKDGNKIVIDIINDIQKRRDSEKPINNEGDVCCKAYIGILLTLAAGLSQTVAGIIVKYMKDYHPFNLAFFRFQGVLLPSLAMALYARYIKKQQIFNQIWPLTKKTQAKRAIGLVLRCALGTTAISLNFYALKRLDVADAAVIGACQPVFVTVAAYFLLGEACGVFPVFAAALSIIGVGIISRPPILTGKETFDEDAMIGTVFSTSAMFITVITVIILRYLKDVHVSLVTLALGIWGTIQSSICSYVIGDFKLPQSIEDWVLAIALASVTFLAKVGITLALKYEQAGPVSLVRRCDLIFAFILQFLLLNIVPDLYSVTGASIIIICVVLITLRKWISKLPDGHAGRKLFWFVLK